MQPTRTHRIATGLATLYSVCALTGYGLHVLTEGGLHGCSTSCQSHAVLRTPSPSHRALTGINVEGRSHSLSISHGRPSADLAVFLSAAVDEDADQCLVCLLLAQLRVGQAQSSTMAALAPLTVDSTPTVDIRCCVPAIGLADARGPPSPGLAS